MTWISFPGVAWRPRRPERRRTRRWCGAGPFCPGLARWQPPGRHKGKECPAGNIQTHGARRGRATEARPDRGDREPEWPTFHRHKRRRRRLKVETDHGGLGLEIRVIAGHVVTPPGRLQTNLGPDAGHSHVAEAQCGGKFARTPMRGAVGRLAMQGPINNAGFQALSAWSYGLARMASPETGDSSFQKTVSPEFDGIDAANFGCD